MLVVAIALFLFRDLVPSVVVWVVGLVFVLLGVMLIGMGVFFRWAIISMKYVLTQDTLTIIGGSIRYDVPIADIERAYARDINNTARNDQPFSANAVNTPGLALANVTWRDTGLLKMCGTSWKNVVLIVTPQQTYGITPLDTDAFLAELGRRGVTIGQAANDTNP
jgi:hypothetical protein